MNAKDKELAVKIFDHFILSKHEIFYWRIYPKFAIDSYNDYFSLDCCIQTADGSDIDECFLKFSNNGSVGFVASFIMPTNKEEAIMSVYRHEGYPFSNIPDDLKANVIEECLKRNKTLYASSINDNLNINIMLIPAAKSLEELMIKVELES